MKFLALSLLALTLTVPASAREQTEAETVLQRLHEACQAYEDGDAEYLADFLHADYTLTNTRGMVTNRAQDLAELRSGDPDYDVFRNHDMQVRIYGDTAVVNGITSLKGTSNGKAFELDARFTDTLIRRDGRWMLVASHATRIEELRSHARETLINSGFRQRRGDSERCLCALPEPRA